MLIIDRITVSLDSLANATISGETVTPYSGAISMAKLYFNALIHSGGYGKSSAKVKSVAGLTLSFVHRVVVKLVVGAGVGQELVLELDICWTRVGAGVGHLLDYRDW